MPTDDRRRGPERIAARYVDLSVDEWARTSDGASEPALSESELRGLRGINDRISDHEATAVFVPLCRLLDEHIRAAEHLRTRTSALLRAPAVASPFVIGLAGSVAAGKSTTARVLQAVLGRHPVPRSVDLVTTDGFLLPNAELTARGLMDRKGFPESYDLRALVRFLAEVKAGRAEVRSPVYSHVRYDVVGSEHRTIARPDVLIVEGLNVLQASVPRAAESHAVVSDFFDFTIYVDAPEGSLRRWYVERFLRLRDTSFRDPDSYFTRYARLSDDEAVRSAGSIWDRINGVNLRENIAPTRSRADLVLEKADDHAVVRVRFRRR